MTLPARQQHALEATGRYMNRKERQCINKRKHSRTSALKEQDRLRALGEERIRAYHCPQCQRWHTGRIKLEGLTHETL